MKTSSIYLTLLLVLFWLGKQSLAQENSIRTIRPERPVNAVSALPNSPSLKQSILYFDGLGRELQAVEQAASPGGGDMVQPLHYDSFGRPDREYLPYSPEAVTTPGAFRPDFENEHAAFYRQAHSGDPFGYQEIVYQPSALRSPKTISPPGKAWRPGSGRETTFLERPNRADEQVRIWTVASDGLPLTKGAYAAGELWVHTITDEEGMRSLTYTDKLDRVILKKTQASPNPSTSHPGWHCTYYVYDLPGDLRVVLPPKAVEILTGNWQRSREPGLVDGLYFCYRFDGKKRLIEKKSPGKAKEEFLYDHRDRLVGHRDGNLKLAGQWWYTNYDAHNRPLQTGLVSDKTNRAALQNQLDVESIRNLPTQPKAGKLSFGQTSPAASFNWQQQFPSVQPPELKPGFLFPTQSSRTTPTGIKLSPEKSLPPESFPREAGEILSQSFYDDYRYSKKAFRDKGIGISSLPASGLPTGKLVKNMASGQLMESAVHYDDWGRKPYFSPVFPWVVRKREGS